MKTFWQLGIGDSVYVLDESDDKLDKVTVTGDYLDSEHCIEVEWCDGEKVKVFVGDGDDTESYYQNKWWYSDKEALFYYLEHQIYRYKRLMWNFGEL